MKIIDIGNSVRGWIEENVKGGHICVEGVEITDVSTQTSYDKRVYSVIVDEDPVPTTYISTEFSYNEFRDFLIEAKKSTYADKAYHVRRDTDGSKTLNFNRGMWYYTDTFVGSRTFVGSEVVRYGNRPVWAMSYSGREYGDIHADPDINRKAISLLRKSLSAVDNAEIPVRGIDMSDEDLKYTVSIEGSLANFIGKETICDNPQHSIYYCRFQGGLIIR